MANPVSQTFPRSNRPCSACGNGETQSSLYTDNGNSFRLCMGCVDDLWFNRSPFMEEKREDEPGRVWQGTADDASPTGEGNVSEVP